MKQFRIYLRTRSKNADYKWIGNTPQISIDKLETLEGNRLYALCIEKERSRHYVFIHVFMPGTGDNIGGFIRLEIAVGALTETQARALALAYLKLPIQGDNRVWEAAQKTYAQTADGFCTVDIPALQKEIERLIEENERLLSSESPGHQLRLWESIRTKGSQTQKAIEHLQRYSLSEADGIKVYLNDSTTKKEADLSLQAETDTEDKEERLPMPKEAPSTERPSQEGEALDQLKKYVAGCVFLLVIAGICFFLKERNISTASLEVSSSLSCKMKVHSKTYEISANIPREIPLPGSPNGVIILEILNDVAGSIVLLNDIVISKGVDGKYSIPAQGGKLQILQPKS